MGTPPAGPGPRAVLVPLAPAPALAAPDAAPGGRWRGGPGGEEQHALDGDPPGGTAVRGTYVENVIGETPPGV